MLHNICFMKKYILFSTTIVILSIGACNSELETEQSSAQSDTAAATMDNALAMLKDNCFNCHNADKDATGGVAPTMAAVRQAYLTDGITEQEFADRIIYFINNPAAENSRLPEAIQQYGVMPRLSYNEDHLRLMAGYIYHNDLGSDEWNNAWKNNKGAAPASTAGMSYEDIGLNIANGTKAQLGKNLMAAIKEHGAPGAVTFCNTRAIPLTDSMANVYHASVKRVSDQPRNPGNAANEAELQYIKQMKEQLASGENPKPVVAEVNGKMVGYYAIITNQMCLQCHGDKGKDILPETWTNIKKAYPHDKATGYGENQLRGIWVVEMDKK